MAPFIDADRSKKSEPLVIPERKHLYDLDFNDVDRKDATFAHIASAFVNSHESEVHDLPSKPKTPEKLGTEASRSRTKTIARLRGMTRDKEQRERVHNLLGTENQRSQDEASHQSNQSNQPGYFVYGQHGTNIRREVVIRKGTMIYSPVSGLPEGDTSNLAEPSRMEIKAWHRSTITAIPGAPHRPVDRYRPHHKRHMKGLQHNIITADVADLGSPARKPPKNTEKRSELPLLLRAVAHRSENKQSKNFPDEDDRETSHQPAPDVTKQMWKRGEELPELALAHIRDRVGYKRRSSRHKRMSIIAGRAPPSPSAQIDDSLSAVSANVDESSKVSSSVRVGLMTVEEEQLEPIYPVDEESSEGEHSDSMSTAEGDDNAGEADSDEDVEDWETGLECDDRKENGELNEEFQQLHQASRERELSCRRSMLIQLQNEENAAADDTRRRSKDIHPQKHKRMGRHLSQAISNVKLVDETNEFVNHNDMDVSVLHYESSDDDFVHKRRQLRVKTRDAKVDAFSELSDDEDATGVVCEMNLKSHLGMTEQERDAAFQKLLTQYLGLLQCAPAEVRTIPNMLFEINNQIRNVKMK
ncbi:LOW QUALITY PROTEIN: Hypothetical protein PHPALM_36168 [Phytophthora palmivora]|uniref:Uncharacterized protein n=1 Tax=Phytophthora palmivora TaxID=4796 RepID=A0A2P4X0L5_9STRA|nr:LOW QUALITY PROTEIN: Hypothetical protein PHPALM_36168 [Phytophthora palmivora]